eukprot:9491998-Pyramimonas_sp.AAC.1
MAAQVADADHEHGLPVTVADDCIFRPRKVHDRVHELRHHDRHAEDVQQDAQYLLECGDGEPAVRRMCWYVRGQTFASWRVYAA